MNISKAIRLRYDADTTLVHVEVQRRRKRGRNRGRYTTPLDRIPRANVRELCDLLHDFADDLDRKEQDA